MQIILSLALLLACVSSASAAEYFVRSDGSTTTNCTGLANAAYDGSGTGEACAYSSFQDGLTAVQCGDTLTVRASDSFPTSAPSVPFSVPAKTTGCVNSIADLITVRTSSFASLPGLRVSPANAALMPNIQATGPGGAMSSATGAKWWKFVGIEFTNVSDGSQAQYANTILTFGTAPSTLLPSAYADKFTFDQCYVHPQESGTGNYLGTASDGIVWNAGDLTVTRSYIGQFGGNYAHPWWTLSSVNSTTDRFDNPGVGLQTNIALHVRSSGTLPAGLSAYPQAYWIVGISGTTYQLSLTQDGSAIDFTSNGSGTIEVNYAQGIPSGAIWSNVGGPFSIDDCYLGAGFNPIFLGAGENGAQAAHTGTIASSNATSVTLTGPPTDLQIGDRIALQAHTATLPWSYTVFATTDAATDVLTAAGHNFINDNTIFFSGTLAGGLSGVYTPYYVINATTDTFKVSTSRGGSAVDITTSVVTTFQGAGDVYGHAVVTGIAGNVVTYSGGMLRFEGGTGNPSSIVPYGYSPSSAWPMAGGLAKWRGNNVVNFNISHSTIECPTAMIQYVVASSIQKPKAYAEIKNIDGGLWEGNVFQGWPTSLALTLANQNGYAPWSTVRNLTLRSNWFKEFSATIIQLHDGDRGGEQGTGIVLDNNLLTGPISITVSGTQPAVVYTSLGTSPALTMTHNTVINKQDALSGSMWIGQYPLPGFIFKDNIVYYNTNGAAVGGICTNFANCWPSLNEEKNVIIKLASQDCNDINGGSAFAHYPNSFCANEAAVEFTSVTPPVTVAGAKLLITSPYHNAASDGADVGVNTDTLAAILAGGSGGTPGAATSTVKGTTTLKRVIIR